MLIQSLFFGYDLKEVLLALLLFFLSNIPAKRGRRTGRQAQMIATAGSMVQTGKVSIVLSGPNISNQRDPFSLVQNKGVLQLKSASWSEASTILIAVMMVPLHKISKYLSEGLSPPLYIHQSK